MVVSIIDAIGMGIGFTVILCVLAAIREILATGMIFEIPVMPDKFVPWAAMAMPVGAFLTLGLLLGLANIISKKSS
jgi:electron transport complex protein RnfE